MIFVWLGIVAYLLSVVAMYYIARFMHFTKNAHGPLAPWAWIVPGINTICVIVGFAFIAKDIPILGTQYWANYWDKQAEKKVYPVESSTSIDLKVTEPIEFGAPFDAPIVT